MKNQPNPQPDHTPRPTEDVQTENTSNTNTPLDTRRAFVKKSLAAGIIASQPTILAGLIRAAGGGGGGTTTDPWGTTSYGTTYSETTDPWGTTDYGTTYYETTAPETTDPWGTTDYGTTYYETTDSWGTTDYETTDYETTEYATTPPPIEWEYRLKCVHDPSLAPLVSLAEFAMSPLGLEGYKFGHYDGTHGIDPNGFGENASVIVGIGANEPDAGDVAQSFTVNAKIFAKWVNPGWENPITGNVSGAETLTTTALSSCTISLVNPNSPVIVMVPNPVIIQSGTSVGGGGTLKAHCVVTPAFDALGLSVFSDEDLPTVSLGGKLINVRPAAKSADYIAGGGTQVLAWSIVLERRKKDSNDPWLPDPVQPDWDSLYSIGLETD